MSHPFGWDLPPGVTTADIDRAFGSDDRYLDLLGRLPEACPRCGAATLRQAGGPIHPDDPPRDYCDAQAAHVTLSDNGHGTLTARCDASLYPDHDEDDVAGEPCETDLGEIREGCGCGECRAERVYDGRDE